MSERWYPDEHEYYVSDPSEDEFPVRQGDLLRPPAGFGEEGDPWLALQVLHPSCEIVAKRNPKALQVARVHPLSGRPQADQEQIVRGFVLPDGVRAPRVAWAHTFFLPPVADGEPMFTNFRQVALVDRAAVTCAARLAALSHEARLYFIRRRLHWEQRWFIELEDVRSFEALRIGRDEDFIGPKPEWAQAGA